VGRGRGEESGEIKIMLEEVKEETESGGGNIFGGRYVEEER
jgi:hypothetical protein